MHHSYKNLFSELEKIEQDVQAFGDTYALDVKTLYILNLCVEEVFINIVSYGFQDKAEHIIDITLEYYPNQIELIIEDEGAPFNPIQDTPPPILDCSIMDRTAGGLGIFFIKQMMDELHYKRSENRNFLKLIKKLNS